VDAVSRQTYEGAETQLEVAKAQSQAAREQWNMVEEGAREEDIQAMEAQVKQAEAAFKLAQKQAEKQTWQKDIAMAEAQAQQARAAMESAEGLVKAKSWEAEITAAYPAGIIGSTGENLKAAAEGEKLEWGTLYPNFAKMAEEEGFKDVAETFRMVAKVENYHERRYRKLLSNIEQGKVFKKEMPIKWKCRNCGYVHEAGEAPQRCPVCDHVRSYFEVWCENY